MGILKDLKKGRRVLLVGANMYNVTAYMRGIYSYCATENKPVVFAASGPSLMHIISQGQADGISPKAKDWSTKIAGRTCEAIYVLPDTGLYSFQINSLLALLRSPSGEDLKLVFLGRGE